MGHDVSILEHPIDLAGLADFNLVAAHGGFSLASRAAHRPKATLSRKVVELEPHLGVRLIDRGSRTLRLTPEGRALHERTQGPLTEIGEAEQSVAAGASVPRGTLRISAPIVFAHVQLARVVADFVAAYPHVTLEVIAEDRKVDPVEDDYDLVIRIDPDHNERLVGRRILEDACLLVASPDIVIPSRPGRRTPPFPQLRPGISPRRRMRFGGSRPTGVCACSARRCSCSSSFLIVQDAVLAGAGVALMPKILTAQSIAEGKLVVWDVDDGPKVGIWALQNSRRLSSSKIRAFLDVLISLS